MEDQDQPPDPPASSRLPAELRLEIWKHYFADVTIEYATCEDLSSDEKEVKPAWTSWEPEGLVNHKFKRIPPAPMPSMPSLHHTEPDLLRSCKLFREEGLPLYLERLEDELEEAKMLNETIWDSMDIAWPAVLWKAGMSQLEDLDCRLITVVMEMKKAKRQIEKQAAEET